MSIEYCFEHHLHYDTDYIPYCFNCEEQKENINKLNNKKMTINGKLIKKLDIESGVSKAGKEWRRQSILVEQGGDYNKEVVIGFFGDKIKQLRDLKEGAKVDISVNVYSREFNGKYYHSIDGYLISQKTNEQPPAKLNGEDMTFLDD